MTLEEWSLWHLKKLPCHDGCYHQIANSWVATIAGGKQ
jgi:hypothetical protein